MDIYRILVPTDFSDCSQAALRYAMELAHGRPGSECVLLHVAQGVAPFYDEQLGVLEPNRMMNLLKLLAAEEAVQVDIPIEEVVVYGDPVKKIIEVATDRGADLVVMGTHGKSALDRLVIGSVTSGVLREAPCPVLVVKDSVSIADGVPRDLPGKGAVTGEDGFQSNDSSKS